MEDLALAVTALIFVPYILAIASFAISFAKHISGRMFISFFGMIVVVMNGSLILNTGTINGFLIGIFPILIVGVAVWNNFRINPLTKNKGEALPPLD